MVYVGTCGYSYPDWVGPFYPPGTPSRRFLDFYAQRFGLVEVDYTYYRLPSARTLAAMAAKTGPDFRFSVKATSTLTHEREADAETYAQFRAGLQPLVEQGQLACVLAQFPHSFRLTEANREYVGRLRERLADVPMVVEFRHGGWIRPETFAWLRELDCGFCGVDQPRLRNLVPPVVEYTAEPAYLRFHGRNAHKWWQHEQAWERYDYLYSAEELGEWVEKVGALAAQARQTLVLFNNHYAAQAVQNAVQFAEMLAEAGLPVQRPGGRLPLG